MEIIVIVLNAIQNILGLFMYLMPFGVFDTISTFLDVYSSPLFMAILFIISVVLGFIFLVYFIELFNIPVDADKIQGWRPEGDEDGKKKGEPETTTFLSETLRFIFGQANIGTYKNTVLMYLANVRFKIIPLLLIVLFLYVPIVGGKGYNTVGQFFYANKDFINYGLISPFMGDKDNLDKKIEESIRHAGTDGTETEGAFTDRRFIYTQLAETTLQDKTLNEATNQAVKIYRNVYDKKSYDRYIQDIETQITLRNNSIATLKEQKDSTNMSKNALAQLEAKIKNFEREIKSLEKDKNNASIIYEQLSPSFAENPNAPSIKNLEAQKGVLEIDRQIKEDLLGFANRRIAQTAIDAKYNVILAEMNKVLSGQEELTNGQNPFLQKINDMLQSDESSKKGKLQKLNEFIRKVEDIKPQLVNPDSIDKTATSAQLSSINNSIKEISDQIAVGKNIKVDEGTRLQYAIDSNATRLKNTDWTGKEAERQYLLLLQHKLTGTAATIAGGQDTEGILLFGGRIQYTGFNVLTGIQFLMDLVGWIFQIIIVMGLILMAGWKNLYLMYVSFVAWISGILLKYLGKDKNIVTGLDRHRAKLNQFLKGADGREDREFRWFNENKGSQDTYLLIFIEFFARFGLVYYLLFR